MGNFLLHFTSHELTDIFKLKPSSSLNTDWHGNSLKYSADFYLAHAGEDLIFASYIKNYRYNSDTSSLALEFKTDLWQKDVVELFIADRDSDNYLEININPDRQWWFVTFSNYRKPEEIQNIPRSIRISCKAEADYFYCIIAIPYAELPAYVRKLEANTYNFATILGNDPRHFIATNSDSTRNPDFHKTENYISLYNEGNKQRI